MDLFSTIAAISTPHGTGGISIIRISGEDAVKIASQIFTPSSPVSLCDAESHTIHHGHIVSDSGKKIDEVLVSVMKAPKTFTGEDTVEINCHGGLVVTKLILEMVLSKGAVSAERGEFTKRAFLNGKLDLSQAEAVIDIINSKTNLEQEISVNNLGGAISDKINLIRERIISLIANIGVLIDYPDEGLEPFSDEEFEKELSEIRDELDTLYDTASAGMVLKEGISTAIVGKPNVGKSSLFNLLSGEEKAIVTDLEGTTRDAIEEYIILGDVALRLADTAGIRESEDEIEKIGIRKAVEYITKSELIIFMADAVTGLDEKDMEILSLLEGKKAIALVNKTDKGNFDDMKELRGRFDKVIEFSVKEKRGIDELKSAVYELFNIGLISGTNASVTMNVRHRDAILKAKSAVVTALEAKKMSIPADTVYIDLEDAASALGEIVGVTVSEEVVDRIFHRFCIGK